MSEIKIIPNQDALKNSKDDKKAKQEAEALEKNCFKEATINKHQRDERVKWHMGIAAIIGLWGIIAVVVFAGFSWLWSILAPTKWQYLSSEQLSQLHTVLTSSLLVKAAMAFAKKNFNNLTN